MAWEFSSGRDMDGEAVKECLDDLIANHDRAPSDMKIDKIEADGMTRWRSIQQKLCPAIINYLGDPYGAIIDVDYGVQEKAVPLMFAGTGPFIATEGSPTEIKAGEEMKNYWGGEVETG